MSQTKTQSFVCSACGGTVGISPKARDALLANGCPLCTTPVEPDDLNK